MRRRNRICLDSWCICRTVFLLSEALDEQLKTLWFSPFQTDEMDSDLETVWAGLPYLCKRIYILRVKQTACVAGKGGSGESGSRVLSRTGSEGRVGALVPVRTFFSLSHESYKRFQTGQTQARDVYHIKVHRFARLLKFVVYFGCILSDRTFESND